MNIIELYSNEAFIYIKNQINIIVITGEHEPRTGSK